jgi:hypothetical protein
VVIAEPPARTATQSGLLRFIRYAFMPNRLGYCGPDENRLLFDHAVAGEADRSLLPTLTQFLGPLPYLRAIARGSGIRDPFDERVVEAYWVGNDLLELADGGDLYRSLNDRFRRQLPAELMATIAGKVPRGARAHHSFHVLDVWRQVARLDGDVLAQIDGCRVSWGRVAAVNGASLTVERAGLEIRDGKLALGPATAVFATREIDGRGFVTDVGPGDTVSMHWGWVCERLTDAQARDLERYTRHNLRVANRTI